MTNITEILVCCGFPIAFIVILIIFAFFHIQIIPQYEKAITTKKNQDGNIDFVLHEPGLIFVNLFTTRVYRFDMRIRERNWEIKVLLIPGEIKTTIFSTVAYKIIDPMITIKAIHIQQLDKVIEGWAAVTLREIVQKLSLENIQAEPGQIEKKWFDRMNETTEYKWGVRILNTEIQKIKREIVEIE